MTKSSEILIVNGLGLGEETKGAAVEWLTWKLAAHTIIRSGGCQSAHHITLSSDQEHEFTHYGAGTFEGARTFLKHMVINPVDIFTEALELEEKGVEDPFNKIAISEDCLVVMPYHKAVNRLREILRGKDKKGTVGKGVGEIIRDARKDPSLAIRAGDFRKSTEELKDQVEKIRQYKLHQAEELIGNYQGKIPEEALIELEHLKNEEIVSSTVESFKYLSDLVRIVDNSFFEKVLKLPGVIINEADHGVLHHPKFGFIPHTTEVDPSSQDVIMSLKEHKYQGKIIRIGVTRCYFSRYGAGPFVSFSPEMTSEIREKHNPDNEWLGEFKNGSYDILALKYAIQICGGPNAFGGLIISHLDVLNKYSSWPVCVAYEYMGKAADLASYFELKDGKIVGIKFYQDADDKKVYDHQLRLTQLLKECQPININLAAKPTEKLEDVFLNYVEQNLNVPVIAISRGPRRTDKEIRKDWEHLFQSS